MNQLSPLYTNPSKPAVTVSTNHTQTLIRKCCLMMTSSQITMSSCTLGKCCLMVTNASTFYSCCTSGIKMSLTNQALTAGFIHPITSFRLSSFDPCCILVAFFDCVPSGSCPADGASCTSSFFLSASPHCLVVIWLASPNSVLPLLVI